jgi:hypothetical protein
MPSWCWFLVAPAALAGVASLIFWPRIAQLLDGPAPTAPEEPAERDDQEERPASGADESWSPLRDVANAKKTDQPAPDFDTNVWLVDVHGELNNLEDAFRHDVEHFWNWAYDQLGVDALTRLRLPSSIEHTGELPIVEMVSA